MKKHKVLLTEKEILKICLSLNRTEKEWTNLYRISSEEKDEQRARKRQEISMEYYELHQKFNSLHSEVIREDDN